MGHPPKKKGRDTHTNKRTTVSCYLHVPYWYSLTELTEQDHIRNHPPLSSNNLGSPVHSCSSWLLHHNFHNQEPSKFIHHHRLFTKSYPSLEKQNDSLWFSFFLQCRDLDEKILPLHKCVAHKIHSFLVIVNFDSEVAFVTDWTSDSTVGIVRVTNTPFNYDKLKT